MSSSTTSYGALQLSKASGIHGTNGPWATAGLLIADAVGAGILAMVTAVAGFGWLMGAIFIVVLLSMNVHLAILMWRVRMQCPHANTYKDLVVAAFEGAGKTQQTVAALITAFSQNLNLFLFLSLCTLSMGKGLGMLFYDQRICLVTWSIIGCLILLPIHLNKQTLGGWESLGCLNVLAILGSICVPLLQLAADGLDETRSPGSRVLAVAAMGPESFLLGLNTIMFAFASQVVVVEIIAEMEEPALFYKSYVWLSAPLQGFLFLLVGLVGYYFLGSNSKGMLADNMRFGVSFRVAALCLVIHFVVSYMIKGTVLCRFVRSLVHPSREDDTHIEWIHWACIVVPVAGLSFVVAQSIPFFVDFINLFSSLTTPITSYIIPVLLFVRWHKDTGHKHCKVSMFEWSALAIEVMLAIVMFVMGTIYSVGHIIQNWETYGYPFGCHCEGLWNTCACSAHHPGMDMCLVNRRLI